MKYCLFFVFLFAAVFAFCQEGESAVPLQNEPAEEQASSVSSKISPKEPSLEDFLKHQEELWLQEKADLKSGEASSQSAVLPPPSVLNEEVRAAEEEQKTVKPALESKKTNQASETRKQRESASASLKPASFSEPEITAAPEQNPLEESPADGGNDWQALLKGCVFAVLLGAGVWLLSKYQ